MKAIILLSNIWPLFKIRTQARYMREQNKYSCFIRPFFSYYPCISISFTSLYLLISLSFYLYAKLPYFEVTAVAATVSI